MAGKFKLFIQGTALWDFFFLIFSFGFCEGIEFLFYFPGIVLFCVCYVFPFALFAFDRRLHILLAGLC